MLQLRQHIPFIVCFTVLAIVTQYKYINEFPSHIHAWAQSDRYALSIGFTENGMDLFHPKTHYLNPSPEDRTDTREHGITAVDFPIHDYMVAVVMKVTGSKAPWTFRLYTLIYTIVGMFFLYLLIKSITQKPTLGVLGAIVVFISPVYVYYAAGFLPTIPSLANLIIGYYFYFRFIDAQKTKHLLLALLFVTLAAMARTPFAIFLIGIAVHEGFLFARGWFKNTRLLITDALYRLGGFATAFGIFFLYRAYNNSLAEKYGSMFLGEPMPPDDFDNIKQIAGNVWERWIDQYLSIYQYLILALLVITVGYGLISKKLSPNRAQRNLALHVFIIGIGACGYAYLMLKQFSNHDYYFLDSFYPVVILFVVLLFTFINFKSKTTNLIVIIGISILSLGGIYHVAKTQEERRITGSWDRVQMTIDNFTESESFLDKQNVSKDDRILVIDSYSTNIPFILMNRDGYAVMTTSEENIKTALKWDYQHIVIQDCFLIPEVIRNYPDITSELVKVASNGRISLYRKEKFPKHKTVLEFLQLDQMTPKQVYLANFENATEDAWKQVYTKTDSTGNTYGYLPTSEQFGLTLEPAPMEILTQKNCMVHLKGDFESTENTNHQVVLSVNVQGKEEHYFTQPILWNSEMSEQHFIFNVPVLSSREHQLKIYFMCTDQSELRYDNVSVSFY